MLLQAFGAVVGGVIVCMIALTIWVIRPLRWRVASLSWISAFMPAAIAVLLFFFGSLGAKHNFRWFPQLIAVSLFSFLITPAIVLVRLVFRFRVLRAPR
jgi:hypothetical protein